MNSPVELRALQRSSDTLCNNISTASTPVWFAQKLLEKGFISSQVQRRALILGFSDYEKVAELLDAVRSQVELNPDKYYELLEILHGEPALENSISRLESAMAGTTILLCANAS